MAIGGGGGGGGPVGFANSFTGPAEALEVIGDHAYAYSGPISAAQSPITALSFTSGNFYLVGRINFDGNTQTYTPQTGVEASICLIYFNGSLVSDMKTGTTSETMPASNWTDIIIPPYTEVIATVDASSDDSNYYATIRITGRIYRG